MHMLRFPGLRGTARGLVCALAGLTMLAALPARAAEDSPCGPIYSAGQFGPFDYRKEPASRYNLVLTAHFLPFVESLQRGNTATTPGGDLDYTLRALPNYPRALVSMTRLAQREGKEQPQGARYTIECYYIRALTFRPDDNLVRMLFADFLIDKGRGEDAKAHLAYVDKSMDKEDPFTPYNLGLLYLKAGDPAKARELAQQALLLGNPADGLQNALKKAGAWTDAPAPGQAASAACAPAAADPAQAPASGASAP